MNEHNWHGYLLCVANECRHYSASPAPCNPGLQARSRTGANASQPPNAWFALSSFMHKIPRVRFVFTQEQPGSTVDPVMLESFRTGARMARDLHEMLGGAPAPSVNERGEPG
jgi:hypothetical protein